MAHDVLMESGVLKLAVTQVMYSLPFIGLYFTTHLLSCIQANCIFPAYQSHWQDSRYLGFA